MKKSNKDKLNIAMLGHKRIPSREGGIEIVVEELATRMVNLGHNVTVYNRRGKHVSEVEYNFDYHQKTYKGIQLKNVFTVDKRGLAAMSSSFVAALCVSFGKYDVVHFHAEGPCAMMWIPKLFGKRCIATIHGLDWARSKWGGFATWYIKLGEKVAVKFADEIIVLSKNVQTYFKESYNRDTVFIPNGVNKAEVKQANLITKQFSLEKDKYILFLGRLVPEKGIHYLIEAYRNIDTNKKLVIAGGASDSSNYMRELKDLASQDKRIVFTGFIQGDLLYELYSNAYIYVLPSDLEGMPLSLLEAMSYGNCVLGSDIREIAEVLEDKAVLFKHSNIKDLNEKIEYLESNEEIVKTLKEQSSLFIYNKYNWDKVALDTLYLYGDCVNEKNIKMSGEL